jgi:MoaA/NifB/PqqE/SkfB family radical SAM enzyme
MKLSILYRGSLSSCNYGCGYCPFAKHRETLAEHRADEKALLRFLDWVESQAEKHQISVFFTPWGEALLHGRYQRAFIRLSNMAHVDKVAIQTNLASRLEWVEKCDKDKIALWATYHPGETSRENFLKQVQLCMTRGVALSVGIVGMKEHANEINAMRHDLPDNVYLWINAYKRLPDYYTPSELAQFKVIDPLFPLNNMRHTSRNKICYAGQRVIAVDGKGIMRRCHFIREPIGNIYTDSWENALVPRLCTNETCGCHIGYVYMPHLELDQVFEDGILERIPKENIWLTRPGEH